MNETIIIPQVESKEKILADTEREQREINNWLSNMREQIDHTGS